MLFQVTYYLAIKTDVQMRMEVNRKRRARGKAERAKMRRQLADNPDFQGFAVDMVSG